MTHNHTTNTRTYIAVLLVTCGLAAASLGICANALGVFYTPVSEELGVMRGTFAMHATLSAIATAITSLFLPKILQKYPFKKLLFTGILLTVLTTVAMAYANRIVSFYILGILRGIGLAFFSILPISMTINNWFYEKNGTAMSLAFCFCGVAGAICSPLFSSCLQNFGRKAAFLLMAAILLVCTLPALLYHYDLSPEKTGCVPYGASAGGQQTVVQNTTFNFKQISFFCVAFIACTSCALTGIAQHFPGIADSIGYTESTGAAMISCAMIGNIVMKLLIGFLSDKLSVTKAIVIMMVLNILSLVIVYLHFSALLLLAGSFLFGTVYAICSVGVPLLTRFSFGPENYAKSYAVIGFLTTMGSSVSLTLIGYLYDFTGSYMPAVFCGIAINILSILLIFVLVRHHHD